MRWYRGKMYSRVEIGTDETHNPVTELLDTGQTALFRNPPWTASQDTTEGNRFDYAERTFLTKTPATEFTDVAVVEVKDEMYEVRNILAERGTTALRVRRCKL